MKKILIGIWLVLLLPCFCLAAPAVTGTSGTMSNGETIVITGSDFGATGPTLQFFDDFELGTNGQDIGDTAENAQVGTWRNTSEYLHPTYSNLAAHSGSLSFRANHNDAVDCGTSNLWAAPSLSASSIFYISFWTYLPAGQAVPGTTECGGAGPNWKVWWLTTNDIHQNDYASEIITDPPDATSICWVDGSQDRACWGYGSFSFTKGRWLRWDAYLVGSTSSGEIYLWNTDSGQARNLVGSDTGDNTLDAGTSGWGYLHFPGFGRKDSNSNTYYDDIYVATGTGAQARVEIGNNSTYTSCTNLAIFTPTSWSDTSITTTMRAGSFGTSGTAYLFVTDSDGNTSAGYEVTLGSSSSSSSISIGGGAHAIAVGGGSLTLTVAQ